MGEKKVQCQTIITIITKGGEFIRKTWKNDLSFPFPLPSFFSSGDHSFCSKIATRRFKHRAEREREGEMVSYSTSEYIVSRDVSALHRYGTALLSGGAQRIRADRSKISLLRSLKRSPGGQDLTVDRCSPAKMLRSRWAKRRL